MRRIWIAVLGTVLAVTASATAAFVDVEAAVVRSVSGVFQTPEYSVNFYASIGDGRRLTGTPPDLQPSPPGSYGYVRVTRKSDGAVHAIYASNLSVVVDPLLEAASIAGTLDDASGSITIFATITASGSNRYLSGYHYTQLPLTADPENLDLDIEVYEALEREATAVGGFSSTVLGGASGATGYAYIGRGVGVYAFGSP